MTNNGLAEDLHKAEELNSTNLMKIAALANHNLSKDVRLMKMEERNMTRKNMIAELHELYQKNERRLLLCLGLTWCFVCVCVYVCVFVVMILAVPNEKGNQLYLL